MLTSSDINQVHYEPEFSIDDANEMISACKTALFEVKPDLFSVLVVIEKLETRIKAVEYDQSVVKNLMQENQLLSTEIENIKLQLITERLVFMNQRVRQVMQDCANLQRAITETQQKEHSPFVAEFKISD